MSITHSSMRLIAVTLGVAAVAVLALSVASAPAAHAASVCPGTTWSVNIKQGATSADVMKLQQFLNMDPDTMVASSGVGSAGMETTYFGAKTTVAVKKFQQKYKAQILTPLGLSTPTPNFYAASRAQANSLCAGSTGTGSPGTPPVTGSGTASVMAAAQPANTIAPYNAARVPFTAFTVTAGGAAVTVNSVTVTRQGPSLDTDFAGVVLIDASTGVQVGVSRVLDSNHSATVGSPITIPAGSSKTFWVAGNISAAPGAGDIASFAVTAVNTGSTVSGSFPIVGASNTMNATLAVGSATVQNSSFDPNSATSQPIGTTGYRFTGVRIQSGAVEDLTFKSITWYSSGSASGLQNVTTVVNGTSYPTTVDSTGRYYTAVFPGGIVIPKGQSIEAYVSGDLGANTTASTVAEFDVYRNTDIYLTGNNYGFGITPTIGSVGTISADATHASHFAASNTGNPFFQGSTVSVTAGTFSTIQNATSVGAQNVAVNVANQPLGGFQTNLTGENITVQSLRVNFALGTALTSAITNISLVNENGAVVAGPFDDSVDNSASHHVTFTGSINFPTGTHTYTIKGQIPSTVTNGTTIQATTSPAVNWTNVSGNTTGNNITISAAGFSMNTMTVKAATLTVGNGSSPVAQNVVAGSGNTPMATIQLDASQSGEDIRLSAIPTVASTSEIAKLNGCQIWDGTTALNTGSRVVNGSSLSSSTPLNVSFSLDNALTIPKGTVKSLTITCTISSTANGSGGYRISADSVNADYSVTGSVSGAAITTVLGTLTLPSGGGGPLMSIASAATLAATTDSAAPAYTVAAGGTTGVTLNVIRLRSSNEAVNLQKLGLTMTNAATAATTTATALSVASSTPNDITQLYLYAGSNIKDTSGVAVAAGTLLGTAIFTNGQTFATSTLTGNGVQLPKDTDATIVVKGDLADIGTNLPGADGNLLLVDYLNSQGVGASSGATVSGSNGLGSNAGVAGVRVFNTYPSLAAGPTIPVNPNGSNVALKKFQITANSSSPVSLYQISFTIATSNAIVTNLQLKAYTDSGYSTPANVPGTTGGQFGATACSSGCTAAQSSAATTLLFTQSTTPYQFTGTTYFTLTGNVAPIGTANNWTVAPIVAGDASTTPIGTTTTAGPMSGATYTPGPSFPLLLKAANTNGNFVWGTNATSTNAVGDNAFSNGYGLPGLPSTGL